MIPLEQSKDGKIVLAAETPKTCSIYISDGNNSQRIYTKEMDYDTAKEVFDYLIDNNNLDDMIKKLKIEVAE